jgi:ABC-type lipoprotein release transport system permease subunit
MTLRTLILRSLRFHARSHLGVLLGATLGSAILIGALLVGDSVRGSLRDMALARLGKIEAAMATGDRLFRAELASNLKAAPVLALPGTANSADGARRANRVHVLGVDESFWKLAAKAPAFTNVPPDSVVLNEALAQQLAAKPGDEVLLRVSKVSALSQDVALTTRDGQTVALRLRVHAVVGAGELGRFSLQANQVAPFNAYVPLRLLQAKANALSKANLAATDLALRPPTNKAFRDTTRPFRRLLEKVGIAGPEPLIPVLVQPAHDYANVQMWALQALQLEDFQLSLRPLTNSPALELRTDRIFLDSPAARAALAVDTNSQPVLTYLATLLRAGTNATAYPMVTAAGVPLVPADLRDDEIVVNQWLADQLQLKPGGELELSYFLPDSGARLTEATNRFRVRAIVPMQMPWADRTLMPDFPGIASAERIGDWDAGFPLTHRKLVDDPYWKQWRGTPKAFVSLSAGRKMWGNRFGDTTAVRFPVGQSPITNRQSPGNAAEPLAIGYRLSAIEKSLLAALKPADFGLVFQPVREQALKASREGQDFGGLFIGFSFFLIVAACVLVALLFQFGVEQRAKEVGTLLALGFTPKQVRRLLLGEGAGLAVLGAALGAVGAVWYARAMLHGLSTVWRDAVGTSDLRFHAEPATLAGGFAGAVLVAVFSLWLALRKQVRQPARVLLAGGGEEGMGSSVSGLGKGARTIEATRREVAVLPHPGPLPLGEGTASATTLTSDASGSAPAKSAPSSSPARTASLPLSAGEGRGEGESVVQPTAAANSPSPRPKALLLSLSSLLLAFALLGWALATGQTANAGAFFGAGALLLIAALAFTAALLTRLERSEAAAALTVASLGIRNTTRRRSRSLATATMLACGSFLVLSIGVFRLDENANATKRSSGTGGFALLGESTLPVVQDLNTKAGREALGLDEKSLEGVSVVPFRVRDGDDASCLNLNRAQKPRLLGVKQELLAERKAFEFAGVAKELAKEGGWQLLNGSSLEHALSPHPSPLPRGEGTATEATGLSTLSAPAPATGPASPTQSASLPLPKGEGRGEGKGSAPSPTTATPAPHATKQNTIPQTPDARPSPALTDPIPAIADMNSILWAMGKRVGDIIEYPEPDERGRPLRLRLVGAVANSILQGNLIIAEDEFTARFPSEAGYRYFLVDAPTNRVADVSASLTRALRDFGLELTPTTRRMAQLNAVQNTYLGTFQILGGLGLLLGSAGLGVVVLRNVLERRGELALLLALGFRAKALRWLVLSEHAALLLLGLLSGVVAAGVAVLPSVLGAGELPVAALALTLGGVLASGFVWTWLATVSALRGQLLDALRNQ